MTFDQKNRNAVRQGYLLPVEMWTHYHMYDKWLKGPLKSRSQSAPKYVVTAIMSPYNRKYSQSGSRSGWNRNRSGCQNLRSKYFFEIRPRTLHQSVSQSSSDSKYAI